MSSDLLSSVQFQYDNPERGSSKTHHRVQAYSGEKRLGDMEWNVRGILNINVEEEYARQGVATAMWHEGHRLAEQHARIPKPKHSPERTTMGDAWAKAVGGRLPRRSR